MSLDVKKAVDLARGYLAELVQIPISEFLLEEVQRTGTFWEITISYPDPGSPTLRNFLAGRTFRVVTLDADTGEFVSMKIRTVAHGFSA